MIRFAAVVLFVLSTIGAVAQQDHDATPQIDSEHTQWIDSVLRSVQTVKVGMTRSELMRVFTVEGGLSFASQRTFVYRECPYIKVDVKFDSADQERPTDRITEISRPFLEWSIYD